MSSLFTSARRRAAGEGWPVEYRWVTSGAERGWSRWLPIDGASYWGFEAILGGWAKRIELVRPRRGPRPTRRQAGLVMYHEMGHLYHVLELPPTSQSAAYLDRVLTLGTAERKANEIQSWVIAFQKMREDGHRVLHADRLFALRCLYTYGAADGATRAALGYRGPTIDIYDQDA